MSPEVSVLVPVGGSDPHRKAAWAYVRHWYTAHHPDFEVVCGVLPPGSPWCKAEAVAQAARQAAGHIFVVADADSFASGLGEAVAALDSGYAWAMPHYTVHRLSEAATAQVFQGHDPLTFPRTRGWYAQPPYVGFPGGGITAVRREVYESAPMDPRFTGWGQEDEAWALALRVLHGRGWRPARGSPLWHLWHPPQPRMTRATGSEKSRDLLSRYKASRSPVMMASLLEGPGKFYRETVSGEVSA